MSARRPHVVLVAHDVSGQQGTERVVAELVRGLHERVRFTVVARQLAVELQGLASWRRAPAPSGPYRRKAAAFFVSGGLQTALARGDLVHVHAIGPMIPNRADLLTVHFSREGFLEASGVPTAGRPSARLHTALERWTIGRARLVAALSDGSRRELEARFPGTEVVVTPNGVDSGRFRPDAAARRAVREGLDVPEEQPVALFVANSWRQKGLRLAIEGLARSPGELWVVGYGDEARYREYARAQGVDHRVRFLGLRTDVAPLYAAADLLVLPSVYEQMSLAAWEAAATGLPVVATRVHGMEELVGEDEAGMLVEGAPAAVGEALRRLATDADLRRRLGDEARRRAGERTWQRSVEAVTSAYARLLERRGVTLD